MIPAPFEGLIDKRLGFLGATGDYEQAKAVLFGVPMDFTVSFRPGSRLGPARIREVSDVLEEYSLALDEDLADHPFYDLGDVALPFGNVEAALDLTHRVAERILAAGKIPFALGGEHLITWPLVQAALEAHPDLRLLQFDAHADLRPDYLGEKSSHASVIRRIAEELPPGRIYQFGIRSATREEVEYAREHTRFYPRRVWEPVQQVLPELHDKPLYITLDIDVLDPAYAPGTGTPEPGGISTEEMLNVIEALRGFHVVGFDLVETAPGQDPTERTPVAAAKLVREALLAFA